MRWVAPEWQRTARIAGCMLSLAAGCLLEAAERKNILFIAVDDLRTELGCYGVSDAVTPHLDALAERGILFTRHHVQVPTCSASRYALLTGRSPARSGVTRGNAGLYQGAMALSAEPHSGAQSLPELFRRSGYRTVCIGKLSHTPDGKVFAYDGSGKGQPELPNAWDELLTPYGPWKRGWGSFFAYPGGRHREDGGGHRQLMDFTAQSDTDLPDGLMAERAIEVLGTLKEQQQPFFLGVGFFKPHLPFVAPKADWEALMEVDLRPPPAPERPTSAYWHESGEFYSYDTTFEKTRPLAEPDRISARRAYLACVRYVDRQIGKLLGAVDQLGLADETLVVVWGDHGWQLGESALWGKHVLFERALNSTLILRLPGDQLGGLICEALVESIDLYPTLIDYCRPAFRETAWPLDGVSLRPLIEGRTASLRPASHSYWGNSLSLRTVDHRLIATRTAGEFTDVELYDLRVGRDPLQDLAPTRPALVDRLLFELPGTRK